MATSDIFLLPQDQPEAISEALILEDVQRDGYQFDVVTGYTIRHTFRTTDHAVSLGDTISDHVVTMPIRFSLTGILTPYNVLNPISALLNSLEDATSVAKNSLDGPIESMLRQKDQLVQFAKDYTPLTIIGDSFPSLQNMIILSLTLPKAVEDGRAQRIGLSLKQVRIAKIASLTDPLMSPDAEKLGGKQTVEDTNILNRSPVQGFGG